MMHELKHWRGISDKTGRFVEESLLVILNYFVLAYGSNKPSSIPCMNVFPSSIFFWRGFPFWAVLFALGLTTTSWDF
jgi:hypothetical protein